ncbi:MAG: alternative ribosome rescue aminoacyl-tRNA hydrolase ArfB [Gemmataceae bacterium]
MSLLVNAQIQIPDEEFRWSFVRASGPGGQNVNKVASKAVLRWNLRDSPSVPAEVKDRLQARLSSRLSNEGELIVTSQRYRDQPRNIEDCLEKLRHIVLDGVAVPKARKKTRPGRGAKERRLKAKKQRSALKSGRRRVAED